MISVTIVVILLGIILYFWLNLHVKYVRIQTKFGQIDGFKAKSRDGREYSSFVGIPYAQPPVGNLRFQVMRRESVAQLELKKNLNRVS